MKFPKKTAASVMSLSLLLGNTSLLEYGVNSKIIYAQDNSESTLSNVAKHEEHKFSNDEKVKVIVKLKEDAVDVNKLKTAEGRKEREESTKDAREKALKEIKSKGIKYEKLFEYDLLMNGFALETKYEDAKKIQALDFVESVELSVAYDKPELPEGAEAATTSSTTEEGYGKAIDSSNIINIQGLWDKGYKGQGKVVAVIDSGLDPNHEVLRLSDVNAAKYKNQSDIDKVKKEAGIDYGKWYSDKVPFAFNYNDWNNNIKQEATFKSHGMHVAGTAVGNPEHKGPNGQFISGVAPEAQLIFMRVFSETKDSGTESYIYAKALEDAVKLGADTINMSLGSPSGSVVEIGEGISSAISLAKAAGVNVVVAAGNNAYFSKGYGSATPKAANPDYGVVGSPSSAGDAISVANISNSVLNKEIVKVPELKDNADFNNGKLQILSNSKLFDKKDYQYEFVKTGTEKDYEGKDLTGKVALIQRGGSSFEDKVKVAKSKGAVGVLIFFNQGEEIFNLTLNGQDKDFPVAVTDYKSGHELTENNYTLSFTGEWEIVPNANDGLMAGSTSWGMTVDGYLKPDITAPGNDVLSSYNDNRYGLNSGTSMASPHVAGALTLIKQVLNERFPNLSGDELQKLAKHLVMSTANPNFNGTTSAYTSPRRQGAGVLDAYKAAYGDLYVTGENDYGSVSLGNVADKFSFKVVLHNLSDKDQELQYATYLNTDDYYDESAGADWKGYLSLNPRQLSASKWTPVTVPAKGQKEVEITVDASSFADELTKVFTNGYYLEGFVVFYDNNGQKASIPYVGFRGEFENVPVMEKPIYEMKSGEKPVYEYGYDADVKNWNELDEIDATSIFTEYKVNGKNTGVLAGAYVDPITGNRFYGEAIAFSPNGDGNYDRIGGRGVFLRAFENMKVSVYAKDDVNQENPLYEKGNAQGNKNYFNNTSKKGTSLPFSNWDGTDKDGNPLPDGEYQYVLSYSPVVSGAKMQKTTFKVVIDRKAPKITGANGGVYDEATRTFTLYPVIEDGSGIFYKKLSYGDTIIKPNADGTYTIPEGVELKDITYEVNDMAHNTDKITLSNVANNGRGSVEVNVTDKDGKGNNSRRLRYKITNEKGEVVGDDFTKNKKTYKALDFGKYKLQVVLSDEDFRVLSPKEVDFEITKENPTKEIEFRVEEIEKNMLEISFDKKVPAGTKVYAVDKNGKKTLLPTSLYGKNAFQKRLENGTYTIQIETPEGYTPAENNFTVEVKNGHNNKQVVLNIEPKVATVPTTENSKVEGSVTFGESNLLNSYRLVVKEPTEEQKEAIKQKLIDGGIDITKYDLEYFDIYVADKDGKEVKLEGNREVVLNLAKAPAKFFHEKDGELVSATNPKYADGKFTFTIDSFSNFVALTDKNEEPAKPTVNKAALEALVEADKNIDDNAAYQKATVDAKARYNTAIEMAKRVLNNEETTQEEIDRAVQTVNEAKAALGSDTKPNEEKPTVDKSKLISELAASENVQATAKYKNADKDKKENFTNTIKEATAVLDKADATAEEVQNSFEKLTKATAELNGKDAQGGDQTSAQVRPEVTPGNNNSNNNNQGGNQVQPGNNGSNNQNNQGNTANPSVTPGNNNNNAGNGGAQPTRVNKKELLSQLNNYTKVVDKAPYNRASDEEKQTYLDAIKVAQDLLASEYATQEEVDKALANLKKSEEAVTKKNVKDKVKDLLGVGDVDKDDPSTLDEPKDSKKLDGNVTKSKGSLSKTGLTNTSTVVAGLVVLGLAVVLVRRKVRK